MDYRQRLIQHYVTTHFAALRELSIDACERHRTTFQAYFQHLLPEDKEAKFLDIGCGYGSLLSMWLSTSQSAKCLICEILSASLCNEGRLCIMQVPNRAIPFYETY